MDKKHNHIAVASPKGGGGKSTTATELAVYCADNDLDVLCIDQDNIGSITNNLLGLDVRREDKDTVIRLYDDPDDVESISTIEVRENISLLQADTKLESIVRQNSLNLFDHFETNIPKIEGYAEKDVVIFDTPAGNGNTVFASLIASDVFYTPIDLEQNSIGAVKQLVEIIKPIKRRYNQNIHFAGFVLNKVSKFTTDETGKKIPYETGQRNIYYDLMRDFGEDEFIGMIGERTPIVQAASRGEWVKGNSDSAKDARHELTEFFENLLAEINKKRF